MTKPDSGDSTVGWHVQPYLAINEGPGTFYAGFRLDSTGAKNAAGDKVVNWAIPLGIAFNF